MSTRNIIVMGASSGGVGVLRKIIGGLPADFPASVFVVLHISAESASMLPEILSRSGRLEAKHPHDGEELEPGTIYVAPPDRHMLISGDTIRLDKGPRENGHRPAVDPLFTSAATSFGPRVIGVILSGSGDDGTAGLHFVKDRGGRAVVQAPTDSMFPNMPNAALLAVAVDACAPAEEIPRILVDMVRSPGPLGGAAARFRHSGGGAPDGGASEGRGGDGARVAHDPDVPRLRRGALRGRRGEPGPAGRRRRPARDVSIRERID